MQMYARTTHDVEIMKCPACNSAVIARCTYQLVPVTMPQEANPSIAHKLGEVTFNATLLGLEIKHSCVPSQLRTIKDQPQA